MTPQPGEQGKDLYEFLAALPPNQGVSMKEMMEIIDGSDQRVSQIVTRIRQGRLPVAHTREQAYPSLTIHFDRTTEKYYNLSNPDSLSVATGAPGEVLRTWLDDLVSRAGSFSRLLEAQVDAAAEMESNADAMSLFNQIPKDQIDNLRDVVDEMVKQQARARNLLRERRRRTA